MAGKCPREIRQDFIEDAKRGFSASVLAEKYGRSRTTINDWRRDLWHSGDLLWYPGIEMFDCLEYDDHVEIEGDAIVVSDLEVPYHDGETLGYAVSIGKLFDIKRLVIGGDFLANDAVGHFAQMAEDTDESIVFSLSDSLMMGRAVLESLFYWFDEIILIKGNHEQRATRIKEVGFFNMMRRDWEGLGDLTLSYYKWCLISGIAIEHPTYRKVPGSIARERAEVESRHTLAAHTHHLSLSFTKSGKFLAGDLGHCTVPERRYYKQVNGTTAHPKWIRGFWAIRKGHLYPFPIDFTDWDFWLREVKLEKKKKRLWDRG